MPAYISLLVPGGLALFAAVLGFAWAAVERRQERARIQLREEKKKRAAFA